VAAGVLIDLRLLRIGGFLLIGWAVYHWRSGHRHRVRVGCRPACSALRCGRS
jgi:hypothetical protein